MSARTLQLDERTYGYLLNFGVRESELARQLREETQARPDANMQISPEQGQFLSWLVDALGVARALEIGTFTGYSALHIALALPDNGFLLACDIETTTTDVGKRYWTAAGVASKVQLAIAPAGDTLLERIRVGESGSFDFAFIDADKESYLEYVELCYALLRRGGVIAIDNVLWSGAVADPTNQEASTEALRKMNAQLATDLRWSLSMVPIGDGLTLLRKR